MPPESPPDLSCIPTCELVRELSQREAVSSHAVEPYEDYSVTVNGPVIVLIVWD